MALPRYSSDRAGIKLRRLGAASETRNEDWEHGQAARPQISARAVRGGIPRFRRGGRVAARCARAAAGEGPTGRLDLGGTIGGKSDRGGGISPGAEGARLYRGSERRRRVPLRRG